MAVMKLDRADLSRVIDKDLGSSVDTVMVRALLKFGVEGRLDINCYVDRFPGPTNVIAFPQNSGQMFSDLCVVYSKDFGICEEMFKEICHLLNWESIRFAGIHPEVCHILEKLGEERKTGIKYIENFYLHNLMPEVLDKHRIQLPPGFSLGTLHREDLGAVAASFDYVENHEVYRQHMEKFIHKIVSLSIRLEEAVHTEGIGIKEKVCIHEGVDKNDIYTAGVCVNTESCTKRGCTTETCVMCVEELKVTSTQKDICTKNTSTKDGLSTPVACKQGVCTKETACPVESVEELLDDTLIGWIIERMDGEQGNLYIREGYRNRGLAKYLLLKHAQLLKQAGRPIFAYTALDNEPAIKLFEKCGYSKSSVTFLIYTPRPMKKVACCE